MVDPPSDRMTVFKAVVAAMSGRPTLIANNPLCPPERQVEIANELMQEWGIKGVAARVTSGGVFVDRAREEEAIV
jgi:hypothetical protein